MTCCCGEPVLNDRNLRCENCGLPFGPEKADLLRQLDNIERDIADTRQELVALQAHRADLLKQLAVTA